MVEQNNEFLMKNYESHSTGSNPFLEVNATMYNDRGRGHGWNNFQHCDGHYSNFSNFKRITRSEEKHEMRKFHKIRSWKILKYVMYI